MTIQEIAARYKDLEVSERRSEKEDYAELVFLNKDAARWDLVLTELFGAPVKPKGKKPSREESALTDSYGGVQANQVLFKKDCDNGTALAMLWPWQDNAHTTLKIILLKK